MKHQTSLIPLLVLTVVLAGCVYSRSVTRAFLNDNAVVTIRGSLVNALDSAETTALVIDCRHEGYGEACDAGIAVEVQQFGDDGSTTVLVDYDSSKQIGRLAKLPSGRDVKISGRWCGQVFCAASLAAM